MQRSLVHYRLAVGLVLLTGACGGGAGGGSGGGGGGGRMSVGGMGGRGGAGDGGGGSGDGALGGGGGGERGRNVAGGMCATMEPCGGDVAGNWTIMAACLDFALDLSATCPGLTSSGTTTNTGSVAFKGDMTYEETFTVSGTLRYQFPSACLSGRTCAEQQDYLMQMGTAMGSFTSVTCQSSGGDCGCEGAVAPVARTESGSYSVSGGILTTIHGRTTDENSYCVAGDTMHQMPVGGAGNPSGTVAGTVTLSRAQ